jgi:hypothetical protein
VKELGSITRAVTLGFSIFVATESLFGQGSFVFDNGIVNFGPRAAIYAPDPGDPHRQQWGNTQDARVPGTQAYAGALLVGNTYSVQAWYSLSPVVDVFQLAGDGPVSGPPTLFNLGPGYFAGYERVVPGALDMVYLQVRAWDNAGGQLGSWDEAWNAALAGSGRAVGWSKVFEQPLGIGSVPYPGMMNFESYNIFVVPEPGTVSLVVLGGTALFWSVRRRRPLRRMK